MKNLHIAVSILSLLMFQRFVSAEETTEMRKEPHNMSDFDAVLISSLKSQTFVYVIGSQQISIQSNENFGLDHSMRTDVKIYALTDGAKRRFHECLIPRRFGPADAVADLNYRYSDAPKNFFFSKYNNDQIGNMSFDRKFGIWENDPTNHVFFLRGNCVIVISSPNIGFIYGEDRKSIEFIKSPDPREIAWRIDQYLKGDPLEKFSDGEKTKLKTLAITLPELSEFEQGVEYALDFPRKLPNGTVPAEIRLVVSRGEIQQVIEQQVIENPRVNPLFLAPDIDGKYTVLFGQPDKQTVHCYHINEEGKCLAWGEIEVFVKEPENPKSE